MAKRALIQGVLLLGLCGATACSRSSAPPPLDAAPAVAAAAPQPGGGPPASPGASNGAAKVGQAALPATSRKVIRNAELSMVVASPSDAELKISELTERLGGYVASSEHQAVSDTDARANLSLRVPVTRMDEALRELRKLSVGPANEKIGSDDVTDEYIDLGAHITNQLALEKQLATILAQAGSVDGALKVHHELTGVRTEIDRLQGRLRFLEGEAALSKISVTLTPKLKPPPVIAVEPVTFAGRLRDALASSIDVARALTTGIVLFFIQAAGVVLPLAALFGLPTFAVVWLSRKRHKRLAAV